MKNPRIEQVIQIFTTENEIVTVLIKLQFRQVNQCAYFKVRFKKNSYIN